MQDWIWPLAGGLVGLTAYASWADRRRMRRADLDRPGWVPWPMVMILSIISAAVLAAIGLKLGG